MEKPDTQYPKKPELTNGNTLENVYRHLLSDYRKALTKIEALEKDLRVKEDSLEYSRLKHTTYCKHTKAAVKNGVWKYIELEAQKEIAEHINKQRNEYRRNNKNRNAQCP